MRMIQRPRHSAPPTKQTPSDWMRAMVLRVSLVVAAEADDHLVEDDVVEDRDAGLGREAVGEAAREPAVALDHVGDALAARGGGSCAQVAKPRARRDSSGT